MHSRWRALWVGIVVAMMGVGSMAMGSDNTNGRGRHKKIYAVPTPGAVTIDGALDDWDLSAQIEMYVIKETSEMQSAKFAVMYDEEALYLGAAVRDPNPMMNRHDPAVDGNRGWDADACQFRLTIDPEVGYPIHESAFDYRKKGAKDTRDDIVHLILWHYTDAQKACLQMHLGMGYRVPRPAWAPHGVVPDGLFAGKYRKAEDGKGYTFEYRIPWSTLGAKAPLQGGDLVAGTVQFNWSRPDGLKTAGGAAWAYDVMGGPGFAFQSTSCWGKIIFSPEGNVPKDLVEEGVPPEKPMPLRFSYTLPEDTECTVQIFDQEGKNVRILVPQGARRAGENVELWDGLDDHGNPLAPGEYVWKGVYHDPLKTKFVLSVHNSGEPPYHTDNNKGGWGGDHGRPTGACRAGDQLLLTWDVCENGWGIIKVTPEGKKVWGSKHSAKVIATDGTRFFTAGGHGFHQAAGVKVFDLKDARPLNWGGGNPLLQLPEQVKGTEEEAAAYHITGLAYAKGVVYVAYGAHDRIALFDAQSGAHQKDWTVPAPGRMVALADGQLAAISGEKVVRVADGAVRDLAVDHLDGPEGIAVGEDGNLYVSNQGALQNISVFSPKGAYLRSIGKAGGRPAVGLYDKDGLYRPGGIAIGPRGHLWVAGTTDGPKRHSVWNVADGTLVNEFFGGSSYFGWAWMDPKHPDEVYNHTVLWKVDLDKKTWRPHSTVWRKTAPNMAPMASPGGYSGHFRVVTAKNGRQFGFGMAHHNPVVLIREGDIFKPFLHSFPAKTYPATEAAVDQLFAGRTGRDRHGILLWQDGNDDQTIQPEECIVSPSNRRENMLNWLDEDLNLWCDGGYVYRPTGEGEDGRPLYDLANPEKIPFRGGNANCASLWRDGEGNFYTLDPGAASGLSSWTADWQLRWRYSPIVRWNQALNFPIVKPGRLWGLTMPLGCAGNFTGAATYYNPYHVFTLDGIYVGQLMRDGRTGGLGPDVTASETLTGQLVKPEGMGDRYFLLAGAQDGRITEVFGLDTVKYLKGGTYVHTPEMAALAKQALEDYEKAVAKSQKLNIARGRAALETASPVGKAIDDKRSFEARAAWEPERLIVRFDVKSPHPLVNTHNDATTLFKGGNLLDIQIATAAGVDAGREKPVPGDVRLLVSQDKAGKTVAMLYRPKVAGFDGKPTVLRSPTGTESFDAIEDVSEKVKLAVKPARLGGAFQATVTIPNALIGLEPKAGRRLQADLGYIFGNKAGTQVAARLYWFNTGFAAGVTADIPNESRLVPKEWGAAILE